MCKYGSLISYCPPYMFPWYSVRNKLKNYNKRRNVKSVTTRIVCSIDCNVDTHSNARDYVCLHANAFDLFGLYPHCQIQMHCIHIVRFIIFIYKKCGIERLLWENGNIINTRNINFMHNIFRVSRCSCILDYSEIRETAMPGILICYKFEFKIMKFAVFGK